MEVPFPAVEGVEHRFVDVPGLRMHVAEAGAGAPVLMLHGWPQHWYEWRHVIPRLADRYRLLCPDLRGFGWTAAPPEGYEKEALAGDVLALLDALGLDRVKLVGHDWGAWIGFLMCLRAPERVERYLALNILHPWQTARRVAPHAWRFSYQLVIAGPLGPWLIRSRPELVRLALRLGVVDPAAWSREELDAFVEPLRQPARAAASARLYRTFLLGEAPAVLRGRRLRSRLRVPARIVLGEQDPAISPKLLAGYEPYADDLSVEIVPDCGHFIADERPELVAARARELFG